MTLDRSTVPSNAIALPPFHGFLRFASTLESTLPSTFYVSALRRRSSRGGKKKKKGLTIREGIFCFCRFVSRHSRQLENPGMKRVSFRVEHAISSFRWREFRERGYHAIPRLISHFYPDKSRFLFRWVEEDALDKKSQTINFLVNRDNCVVPR